ncbi:MAG: serine O-acetyltransferase [Ruminococcaceae bacterium]|nr:serine O-acetyltransferase [Oscillospiraceae bacterium]
MFTNLRETIASYKARDPAARTSFEILMLYPGVRAIISHRCANWFHRKNLKYIARMISQRSRRTTGIEIHPGATIGKRLVIDHGMGIVIGETTEIGDDCILYQGVTLGGTGKDVGKRHPTIGNNVLIGSGAKVLGPFSVGDNSRIAANSVVLSAIPQNSTAIGAPARLVKENGKRVDYATEVDQINVSDPVLFEILALKTELDRLSALVEPADLKK